MNASPTELSTLLVRQSWQIAFVALVVALVVRLVRRRHPHLAYALWCLVLLKALTPPVWNSPVSLCGWVETSWPAPAETAVEAPRPAPMSEHEADEASLSFARRPGPGSAQAPPVDSEVLQPSPVAESTTAVADRLWNVWWIGALLVAGVTVVRTLRGWRTLRRSMQDVPPELTELAAGMAQRLGLRHPTPILVTASFGPAVFGLPRPRILLPGALVRAASREQLTTILAHELIHVRRGDLWVALLQTLTQCLWWFHPLVWWSSRAMSRERERCCDLEVIGSGVCDREDYAQCLIDTLRHRHRATVGLVPVGLSAFQVTKDRLEEIMRLVQVDRGRARRIAWAVVLLGAILVLPAGRLLRPAVSEEAQADPAKVAEAKNGQAKRPEQAAEPTGPIQAPQLAYLAWQGSKNADGKPVPHTLWDLKGNIVPEAEARDVLKTVGSLQVHVWNEAEELRPLVLIFRIDPRIPRAALVPNVIGGEGKRFPSGTAAYSRTSGWAISAAAPNNRDFPRWPERLSLEFLYPIETVQTIRTVRDVPEEPIEVAEGVSWRIDLGNRPIPKGPATVLSFRHGAGDWERTIYAARCFLKGDREPFEYDFATIVEKPPAPRETIYFSKPFAGRDAIEKVEFTRQRRALRRIDDIPLRLELLAQLAEVPKPPRTMRLRVVGPDDKPLAGAKIFANVSDNDTGRTRIRNTHLVADAAGAATLELPAKLHLMRLWASRDGHVGMFAQWWPEHQVDGHLVPDEFTFRLEKGTTIGGIIRDIDGKPIEGADVQVQLKKAGDEQLGVRLCYDRWLSEDDETQRRKPRTTDAQGRWHLDNAPAGDDREFLMRFSHPDFISVTTWGEGDAKSLRERSAVNVMQRGIVVSGFVLDGDGKKVPNALVIAGEDTTFAPFRDRRQEVRTDENGHYRLAPLPPGRRLSLSVIARDWAPARKEIEVSPTSSSVGFQLKRGHPVRMRFVDGDGQPIPDVFVQIGVWQETHALTNAWPHDGAETGIPRRADANGNYEWLWAPPDGVNYDFIKEGFKAPGDRSLTPDPEVRVIRLERNAAAP